MDINDALNESVRRIKIHLLMFFLPQIDSNPIANLTSMKFSTWRAFIAHWKSRLTTTLQRENALFILNTSANILYASGRCTPNQGTYIY